MSTILKALKKLEAETPPETGILEVPLGRHSRQPGNRKSFWLFVGISGAVLLLGAGFFLFFKTSSSLLVQEPAVERLQSEDQSVTSLPRADAGPSAVVRGIVRPARRDVTAVPGQSPQAEAIGIEADSAAPPPKAAEPERADNRSSRGNHQNAMEAENNTGNFGKPIENPASATGMKKQPAGDKTPGASSGTSEPLKVLTETGLRIQAISWNEVPARRLAVINSRVCREGEHVSGYRIIRINPDDIVVVAEGKRGKLLF